VVGEACAVVVLEYGVCRQESLDYYVVDIRPHFVDIVAIVGEPFVHGGYAALCARLLVTQEVVTALLYGIVG